MIVHGEVVIEEEDMEDEAVTIADNWLEPRSSKGQQGDICCNVQWQCHI